MGDLESQPMSEILDQDDDQSTSFFDLTNIPGSHSEDAEDEYDRELADKKVTSFYLIQKILIIFP